MAEVEFESKTEPDCRLRFKSTTKLTDGTLFTKARVWKDTEFAHQAAKQLENGVTITPTNKTQTKFNINNKFDVILELIEDDTTGDKNTHLSLIYNFGISSKNYEYLLGNNKFNKLKLRMVLVANVLNIKIKIEGSNFNDKKLNSIRQDISEFVSKMIDFTILMDYNPLQCQTVKTIDPNNVEVFDNSNIADNKGGNIDPDWMFNEFDKIFENLESDKSEKSKNTK